MYACHEMREQGLLPTLPKTQPSPSEPKPLGAPIDDGGALEDPRQASGRATV